MAEDTWSREADKWDHLRDLRISKILGTAKQRQAGLNADADLYIINRENVVWLIEQGRQAFKFDMVIIDELSSFKSAQAKRFKALRKAMPLVNRAIGLTGTPAPNGLLDLWPQMYLLDQGERLGKTITGYRQKYFRPDKYNGPVVYSYKLLPGAEDAIKEKISDICVSMSAKDYLDLPERTDNYIHVILSDKEKKQYREFEKQLLLEVDGEEISASTAAVLSNKLLQFANGAMYTDNGGYVDIHDAKLEALKEIIDTANGKPVLVFYSFIHDKERIKREIKAQELEDSSTIEKWNKGELPVLLCHPASAGHGLNLQAGGNIIVWFGLTWSLEFYQQANARLHRQGQTERVIVHHLITDGTMDEQVVRALEEKDLGQSALMEAVKARLKAYKKTEK